MMNLIALLLVLTGTANIDATGYLHQEILVIRNYNNNNDGLKKVKDAAKGQLNSEWIYEVIVSPKVPIKNYKDFCPTKQTRIVALFLVIFWWV